ncbi:unnamed protein product [Haemonchus placei]|uniref:PiggyBac transposable element-derived protein 3 n=1 Tax=Haemonchus placei TaxID=6290 RepID=A0A0N4X324_HAEPC|nr:unnamed protein product [Haemonchus placei]
MATATRCSAVAEHGASVLNTERCQLRGFRGEKPYDFRACIAIPMFVGKYVLRNYKDYWMSDYRVGLHHGLYYFKQHVLRFLMQNSYLG